MNKKTIPTTGIGWGSIIAHVAGAINLLMDGDPATMPDWNIVIPSLAVSFGLTQARPKNMTSEEARAK